MARMDFQLVGTWELERLRGGPHLGAVGAAGTRCPPTAPRCPVQGRSSRCALTDAKFGDRRRNYHAHRNGMVRAAKPRALGTAGAGLSRLLLPLVLLLLLLLPLGRSYEAQVMTDYDPVVDFSVTAHGLLRGVGRTRRCLICPRAVGRARR